MLHTTYRGDYTIIYIVPGRYTRSKTISEPEYYILHTATYLEVRLCLQWSEEYTSVTSGHEPGFKQAEQKVTTR